MSSPRSVASHALDVLGVLVLGFVYVTLLSVRTAAVMGYKGLASIRSAGGSMTRRFQRSGRNPE